MLWYSSPGCIGSGLHSQLDCVHEAHPRPSNNSRSNSSNNQSCTQSIRYVCHLCEGVPLTSEFSFRHHLARHGGFKHCATATIGLLFCSNCGYIASSSSDFAAHMNRHITERRFSCSACGFDAHHRKEINTHISKYHHHQMSSNAFQDSLTYDVPNKVTNAVLIDNQKQGDIRPKLVNLQPMVLLHRLNLDIESDLDSDGGRGQGRTEKELNDIDSDNIGSQ